MINSFIHSFIDNFVQNLPDTVNPTPHHVAHVMCHKLLGVRCNFFFYKVVELVGGGSVINGATPSSLGLRVTHS